MPVAFRSATSAPSTVKADLLAVPVFAGPEPGPGAEAVDAALDGGLAAFMAEAGFGGKAGETLVVPTRGALGAKAAVLVGVGKRAEVTVDGLRKAAAAVAKRATKATAVATTLLDAAPDGADRADVAQAIAEGVVLGGYKFLDYKSEGEASKLRRVTVLGKGGARVQAGLDRGALIAGAVTWARDRVNTPSKEKSPAAFAAAARSFLRGKGVKVEIVDEATLRREGMGGIVGVGQGSEQKPRLVKVTYAPRGAKPGVLALVGKGVVFDSGGLSLKTAAGMEWMKTDMGGAAAVLATMGVLAELGVQHKVIAYTPLVENMPSGTAIRPGDVLTHRNGKTVEVLNTDAEGRLILADALALAVEDGADAIVDVATLTGACMVALGDRIAGLMGNDDPWRDQVRAAADRVGESVWPLPLPAEYKQLLDSDVADLKNVSGGGYGGALTAGLFLQAFVGDVPWAHLDIAGPGRSQSDQGYITKGGTGFAVRTLVEVARSFRRP